jgi:hypothetical protein
MKVFVAHKDEDSVLATRVAARLRQCGSDAYLDKFDPTASSHGDELGDHLRQILGLCSHLMTVVTQKTKESWWLPWEIGISTEKELPISTFAGESCDLPSYLRKWPYLQRLEEIDVYVRVSNQVEKMTESDRRYKTASAARSIYTKQFYSNIRRALNQ